MRKFLLFGLAGICIAAVAFIAGVFAERSVFPLLATDHPPTLLTPSQGEVLKRDITQEFRWTEVPGAEKYHVYVAHSTNKDRPAVSQEMEVTFLLLDTNVFTVDRGWTWKVKAEVDGQWSNWSQVGTFDIESK